MTRTATTPGRIDRLCGVVLAMLPALIATAASGIAGPAAAPSGPLDRLIGDTLSAVVYVRPSLEDGLRRFALQAYLRRDGSSLVRVWNPERDAYTPSVERSWSLSGDRLCLDIPVPGPGRVCAGIHVWGPRIAGIGTDPYVMIDGSLRPGNLIFSAR